MKYTKVVLKRFIPLIFISVVMLYSMAYADVKVSVSKDKTEAYSHNTKETINENVIDEKKTPLKDSPSSYKSDVDKDNYESHDNYSSIVDVDEDDIPSTSSSINDSSDDYMDTEPEINYADEHYADKLKKGETYEIINKDMVVQRNIIYDQKTPIEYATLSKGSKVELLDFVMQDNKKMAEVQGDNNKVFYEDVENFYNNSIETKASPFSRYLKGIYNDAIKLGTENGYNSCVLVAILLMLGAIFCVKFLDTSVLRLKDPEGGTLPYINSIARIMPGAMIGSFLIIANMFDKNAVDYYFYGGFSIVGKNYELMQWLLQIMLLITVYMLWRIVLEGIKCFTFPCMIIRTLVLILANMASFYLCFGLSYVGVAIYILLVLYQCICVNSYECPDITDECDSDEEESGEEESGEEGEAEPEPEAL